MKKKTHTQNKLNIRKHILLYLSENVREEKNRGYRKGGGKIGEGYTRILSLQRAAPTRSASPAVIMLYRRCYNEIKTYIPRVEYDRFLKVENFFFLLRARSRFFLEKISRFTSICKKRNKKKKK